MGTRELGECNDSGGLRQRFEVEHGHRKPNMARAEAGLTEVSARKVERVYENQNEGEDSSGKSMNGVGT